MDILPNLSVMFLSFMEKAFCVVFFNLFAPNGEWKKKKMLYFGSRVPIFFSSILLWSEQKYNVIIFFIKVFKANG